MAPNWFMPDKSWSIKCIIHLYINYSFLKGLQACIIRRTASCIFKFPLFRATQSVIISAGMPIRKYNSSQGCETTAINHMTKPQRFTKDKNVINLKYVCFQYAVMLVPSETESFIVALTPLVFRFYIILTIMFMSQHDASLFIRVKAPSQGNFSNFIFAASAKSAPSTAVKYSAFPSNTRTQWETALMESLCYWSSVDIFVTHK